MSYQFSVNNTLCGVGDTTNPYGDLVWYNWKEFMKSVGWTVIASSDGISISTTTDIITSPTFSTGGMGNSYSWFILREPSPGVDGYRREFLIKSSPTAGSSNPNARLGRTIVKSVQGFSMTQSWNGLATPTYRYPPICYDPVYNPSWMTQAPQQTELPDPSGNDVYCNPFCDSGNGYVWDYHFMADNTAPYGWYIAASRRNTGTNTGMSGFICHEPLIATDSLDPDPYIFHNYCCNDSVLSSSLRHETDGTGYQSWGWYLWMPTTSYADAVLKYSASGYTPMQMGRLSAHRDTAYVPGSLVGHPASGKNPLINIYWQFDNANIKGSWCKGQGTFLKWVGTTIPTWDTLSINSTKDYVGIGTAANNACVVIPWNGTSPNT